MDYCVHFPSNQGYCSFRRQNSSIEQFEATNSLFNILGTIPIHDGKSFQPQPGSLNGTAQLGRHRSHLSHLRAYHTEQTRCSGIGSQPRSGTLENHLLKVVEWSNHPIHSFKQASHSLIPSFPSARTIIGRLEESMLDVSSPSFPERRSHNATRLGELNGHVWWPESKQQKWHALDTRTSLLQPRC